LFSSTIRDNILYGRRDVSEEMLQRAAKIAHADEFIEKLPNGYDTLIGERGVNLSGGQKQRLALARALVYDPEILVLDDATAALDASTERVIHTRLDPVFRGRTVLVIANRLASVHQADHVIVMENGRITQSGTHQALAASEGHYRDIVMLQELA
jgi:ATP-binding cassette subfamily B protein